MLELTHNHGTESDASFAGYASGNDEPGKGYGHIAITVEDVQAACARFEALGVPFKKRLTDGVMKNIAFIKDPDGLVVAPFFRCLSKWILTRILLSLGTGLRFSRIRMISERIREENWSRHV